MILQSLDRLDKASTPGCPRRRCQVDVDAAMAVAGALHGEGVEREGRRIVLRGPEVLHLAITFWLERFFIERL
jgi:hypothetical protein